MLALSVRTEGAQNQAEHSEMMEDIKAWSKCIMSEGGCFLSGDLGVYEFGRFSTCRKDFDPE